MGRVLSVNISFVAVMMSLARIAATNTQISLNRRMIQMIEKLTNCPQCGGVLNDAGRCEFCGSKVYDFLNISFDERCMPSAKTYLRLKIKNKIVLAPIIVDTMTANVSSFYGSDNISCVACINDYEFMRTPCYPIMSINFAVIGDMIEVDDK